MSEPLADRLKRFTPEGAALDRDTLLFNAGRASVRPGRGWRLAALCLALSQVVTLALLWPRPASPVISPPIPSSQQPAAPASPPTAIEPLEWLALSRRASASEETDLPPATSTGPLVPDEPALSVSTRFQE